jgi:hypothetical protein
MCPPAAVSGRDRDGRGAGDCTLGGVVVRRSCGERWIEAREVVEGAGGHAVLRSCSSTRREVHRGDRGARGC